MRHRQNINNIYALLGLAVLLLVASFYLLGMLPLIKHLERTHDERVDFQLSESSALIRTILDDQRNIALQVASRSAIRNRQVAYLRGEIDRQTLAEFSRPKLADAITAHEGLISVVRYAPDGSRLYSAGRQIPSAYDRLCTTYPVESIRLVMIEPDARRVYYCSPLHDRGGRHIGFDLLVMFDHPLHEAVERQSRAGLELALVLDDEGLDGYWPNRPIDSHMHKALTQYLQTSVMPSGFSIAQRRLEDEPRWQLFLIVDDAEHARPLERQTLPLLFAVLASTAAIYLLTVITLRPIIAALLEQKALLARSRCDGLTGAHNHAYMQELLDAELARTTRYGRPLSLILLDIDHFKQVNDRHGHQAGDQVLRILTQRCRETIRQTDQLARYGGEEFLIILPETGRTQAMTLAERLRRHIARSTFPIPGDSLHITISLGVISTEGQTDAFDKYDLIEAVDRALYHSKREGRDRVSYGAITPAAPPASGRKSAAASRGEEGK
ncbi:diguanylate cyclase [Marichromatium purpuratum 984]|uniref:diguanylate cyclase n=1 Tax=Marichromatium purpuratum 984 TaxID=765910 RepID=W0DYF9_MARPU|nr:GGDEF domain-containing protein [Marichromatium purpuratum]AHF03487.1 diguanylate cyclase [Marichromatium purpuratum 984]